MSNYTFSVDLISNEQTKYLIEAAKVLGVEFTQKITNIVNLANQDICLEKMKSELHEAK